MSTTSTPVTAELFEFIRRSTIAQDLLLGDLRQAAREAGLPEIHIAPEQAAFLQITLAAMGAKTVVEIGTLGGYSAIAMARGLPADGRVITHEIEPAHAEFARRWIDRSDQKGKIEVRLGNAHETLPELADGSACAVFLDADKEGYPAYFEQAMRLLRPGGALFADNVLADGTIAAAGEDSPKLRGLRAFLDRAAAEPGLRGIIVPVGDGCYFGVRS
ncbi:MAG: O-methyltransferase [Planctomycetes bacterium]|nr:O-methyltransferase [Planctomycetota bacterium]